MGLVDQFTALEQELPEGWCDARLVLAVRDDTRRDRAAALLAPAGSARRENGVRFFTAKRGAGVGPDGIRRLLRRLDQERIRGELSVDGVDTSAPEAPAEPATLAESWDESVATLPEDWSDVYGEVELDSSDYMERGALLLAPLNPLRAEGRSALRFRTARLHGYGASPAMVRRCLERLDAEPRPFTGSVRILRSLSDTQHVSTQGPVWYLDGRAV